MAIPIKFIRYILINSLKAGYDYPKKSYYVVNKDTTTYRNNLQDILNVLAALEVDNPSQYREQLQACKDNYETIGVEDSLYYTLEESGLYIKSIQFNGWENYPLVIECEKGKLYIKNSTTIFDLKANESLEMVVAPTLCSFYKETLGLLITTEQMLAICRLLIYYYKPTCVNILYPVNPETNILRYSNAFKLTNYNSTSPAEYICTNNPYQTFNPTDIGNIISMGSNTITLLNPISDEDINKYYIEPSSKIEIQGSLVTIGEDTYTNDGTYTITNIEDNTITVQETLPVEYTFNYYTCYIEAYTVSVVGIDRDTNTITCSNSSDLTPVHVGDTIVVNNGNITTDIGEVIRIDNTYTVRSVSDTNKTITVEEELPTTYTYPSNSNVSLAKEVYLGSISNVEYINNTTVLTLLENIELNNLNNKVVVVYNEDRSIKLYSTLTSFTDNKVVLIGTLSIEEGYPNYPKLQFPVPSKEIMVSVTDNNSRYSYVLPEGDFLTDNYTECDDYLKLLKNKDSSFIIPTDVASTDYTKNCNPRNIERNMYKVLKDEPINISVVILGELNYTIIAKIKGVYKE